MLTFLKALLLLLLVGLNAFFVLAEYSLLRLRRTRLEQLVSEGEARARLIQALWADSSLLFSGIQFGITLASLLMGWLGEYVVAQALQRVLAAHMQRYLSLAIAHATAVGLAFVFVTVLVMVLGELVPKMLAYERAEALALLLASPITWFFRVSKRPVEVLDRLSSGVMRLLRPEPPAPHGSQMTPEEVKLMVSAIRQRGLLEEEQEEMIHSVFELDRVKVREIMVPWPKVTSLPATSNLSEILEEVAGDLHARIPIYNGSPDNIVGVLHTKDLLPLVLERQHRSDSPDAVFDLRQLLHQPMIVPETMSLTQFLEEARPRRAQLALVVDEFGTFVGLVTLDDVIEQIVGEIEGESDASTNTDERLNAKVLVLDGSVGLRQLAEDYGMELPRGAGYETLAGFVLDQLGAVPRGGETLVFEGRRYTVVAMEDRRIARVRVEKIPEPPLAHPRAGSPAMPWPHHQP
jgi:CBS domain containing-hemolysin-like protein